MNILHNTSKMNCYRPNYVCTICSQTFTRRGSCERHRINNNLDPTASVRFIDYIIGISNGRYQLGNPSMHRREIKDKKKSQINDTFFAESYKNAKYAKVFPSRFAIMPDMTSQNMMKGGSRFNETPSISAKSVPADNIEKMDRNEDAVEFCTRETTIVYQKRLHKNSDDTSLRIRRNFESLQL